MPGIVGSVMLIGIVGYLFNTFFRRSKADRLDMQLGRQAGMRLFQLVIGQEALISKILTNQDKHMWEIHGGFQILQE